MGDFKEVRKITNEECLLPLLNKVGWYYWFLLPFIQKSVWVDCSDYTSSNADPLRDFAEKIVAEMNSKHSEDVQRLRNIYVDTTQLHQV